METHTLVVLDLASVDDQLTCRIERYGVALNESKPMLISWNAHSCPIGFEAVGDGVAFVHTDKPWTMHKIDAAALDDLGDRGVAWHDTAHGEKTVVIAILPVGSTFDDEHRTVSFGENSECGILPTRFKLFKNRLALFWELGHADHDVIWKMRKVTNSDLKASVATLNQSAVDHQRRTRVVELEEPSRSDATPRSPAGWLLEAVRQVPLLKYAIAVVGLVAAAALSVGFFFGNSEHAIYGGIAVFLAMFLVRIYVSTKPADYIFDPTLPVRVLVWVAVLALVVLVCMGLLRLGLNMFGTPAPSTEIGQSKTEKSASSTESQQSSAKRESSEPTSISRGPARSEIVELRLVAQTAPKSGPPGINTISLIANGQPATTFAAPVTFNPKRQDAFRISGKFNVPLYWCIVWIDTAGKAKVESNSNHPAQTMDYPPQIGPIPKVISINPEDALGTHLLLIMWQTVPFEESRILNDLSNVEKPPAMPANRFVSGIWTPKGAGKVRSQADSETDAYFSQLKADLKSDEAIYGLFLRTSDGT